MYLTIQFDFTIVVVYRLGRVCAVVCVFFFHRYCRGEREQRRGRVKRKKERIGYFKGDSAISIGVRGLIAETDFVMQKTSFSSSYC